MRFSANKLDNFNKEHYVKVLAHREVEEIKQEITNEQKQSIENQIELVFGGVLLIIAMGLVYQTLTILQ